MTERHSRGTVLYDTMAIRRADFSEMMDVAADDAMIQIKDNAFSDGILEDGYGNIGRHGTSFSEKKKSPKKHKKGGHIT